MINPFENGKFCCLQAWTWELDSFEVDGQMGLHISHNVLFKLASLMFTTLLLLAE